MAIRLNHFDHRVRPRHSLLPPLHLQQILEPHLQMENSILDRPHRTTRISSHRQYFSHAFYGVN